MATEPEFKLYHVNGTFVDEDSTYNIAHVIASSPEEAALLWRGHARAAWFEDYTDDEVPNVDSLIVSIVPTPVEGPARVLKWEASAIPYSDYKMVVDMLNAFTPQGITS